MVSSYLDFRFWGFLFQERWFHFVFLTTKITSTKVLRSLNFALFNINFYFVCELRPITYLIFFHVSPVELILQQVANFTSFSVYMNDAYVWFIAWQFRISWNHRNFFQKWVFVAWNHISIDIVRMLVAEFKLMHWLLIIGTYYEILLLNFSFI